MTRVVIAATTSELAPGWYLLALAYLIFFFWSLVATPLKGKWGFFVAGIVIHWFWFFGAIRLAKPGSFWYRRFYDESKRRRADVRFGRAPSEVAPVPAEMKRCPDCAEEVLAPANVCRFCGYRFAPTGTATAPAEPPDEEEIAPATVSARAAEPAQSKEPEQAYAPANLNASPPTSVPARALAWVIACVVVVAVVTAGIVASRSDGEPAAASADSAQPEPSSSNSTTPGGWQPIKLGFVRKYGIGPSSQKRLRFVVDQGGLYVSATTPPDPEAVVKVAGSAIPSYNDAPTDPHELMWPVRTAGDAQLEILLRNTTDSTRVYTVEFLEVDPTLVNRTWDQVPGLPTGGDNPGSSALATDPANNYQRLELYDDGNAEGRLGQDFPLPAKTRTKIELFPPSELGSCFRLKLRSEDVGALQTSFGSHRTIESISPAGSSGSEISWQGVISRGDIDGYLAPRIDLSVMNTANKRTMARIEFDLAC